jgi:hypothetical protein
MEKTEKGREVEKLGRNGKVMKETRNERIYINKM